MLARRSRHLIALFASVLHSPASTYGFGMKPSFSVAIVTQRQGLASSTIEDATILQQRFHDYNKPIVIIGASGDDNELFRLAASFQKRHPSTNNNAASVLTVGPETNAADLMASIDDETMQWPQIILIDFAQSLLNDGYANIAESLYGSGLLSVYVNVESVTKLHPRLDEDLFVKFSDYEICIRDEGSDGNANWEHIEWELERIIARARMVPAIPGDTFARTDNSAHLTMGQNTFFLSLSVPDITQVEPFVEEMCQDVDAMEYRADLLDCRDSRFDLIYGMQLLRRYCRPHCVRVPALPFGQRVLEDVMPIVYTVRTQNQAGTFPDDDAGIDRMFQMLEWGLRAGVEVLDVESAWDKGKVDALLTLAQDRYSSQILGSEHVLGKQITTEEAVALFHQCAFGGRAHGAKVVLSVEEEGRDRMAYEAALIATELARADGRPVIPNISLVLGDVGKFSRVVNLAFTPVTHRLLPKKAAPGQMTSTEIMTTRLLTKIFTPKKFCILGHNIEYSVSPQMQGAAFAASQLPHDYIRVDTAAVEEFIESDFFKSDDFGGASVTIPHKQSIMPYVDALSVAAKEIGSVNTLIVREEFADGEGFKRVIYGDNTDWRGIYKPLRRRSSTSMKSSDFALILGAGGTARAAAYAANKLGLKCIFYNRTPSKADDLVDSFGGRAISSLADTSSSGAISLGDVLTQASGSSLRVVINTTPAAAELLLPDWLLLRRNHRLPIVFDVNYKPFNTKLLLQAEAAGCSVVRGSEMLWEQGAGQFELWTERTAPYSVMKRVVLDNCAEVIS